jgi:hypothetical protein
LTRESFARMSTSLPRRLGPVRVLLASRADGGLRSFAAGSARASLFSRPARRSLMFQPACSLIPFRDLLAQRLRLRPLPARAAPVASGWSNNYRVGYLPPTGFSRPCHGALQSSKKVGARTRAPEEKGSSLACQIGPKSKLCTRTPQTPHRRSHHYSGNLGRDPGRIRPPQAVDQTKTYT